MNQWLDSLRRLARRPGFTLIALIGLAVGIGANVAIFSIVDGALLRPLSFPQPDRLITINVSIPQFAAKYPYFPVNADSYFTWRAQSKTLGSLALADPGSWVLTGTGLEPRQVSGAEITAGMFSTLGVAPALGRDFGQADDLPEKNHVVILTDAFWRSQFHADRGVIGRTVELDGAANQIVGVMPAKLHFPDPAQLEGVFFASSVNRGVQLFRPLGLKPAFDPDNAVGNYNFLCVARMRPGATAAQVRAELDVLNAGILARGKLPADVGQVRVNTVVQSLRDQLVGPHAVGLWMLLGAVGAILAIVCLNLAGLLLVEVQGRSHELAVRLALGTSPGRLMGDIMREGMLLACGGGALGVLAAMVTLRWLVHAAPAGIPRLDEVGLNPTVLAFCVFLALLCGAVFSWWPARHAAQTDPQEALRAGGRGASDSRHRLRLRGWLVGGQSALAAWLLILAGLLTASYWRVLHGDKGFESQNVVVAQLNWPGKRAEQIAFYRDALAKARPLPGVTAAAFVGRIPTDGSDDTDLLSHVNDPKPMVERPLARYLGVSDGYFAAMGIPLLHGRDFNGAEIAAPALPKPKGAAPAPVAAVISQAAANTLWPGGEAIGRQFHRSDPDDPNFTVVGVVADVRQAGLDRPVELVVYLPYTFLTPGDGAVVVRTANRPSLLAPALRRAVWSVEPDAAVSNIESMDSVLSTSVASRRFQLMLVLVFAGTALFLAALGIYGVVAYAVGSRRREIGLRMALGAPPQNVLLLVLRQGMTPVVCGLAAGLVAATASGRLVASLLFGVPASDATVLTVVAAALLATGLAACLLPARRAMTVEPAEVYS